MCSFKCQCLCPIIQDDGVIMGCYGGHKDKQINGYIICAKMSLVPCNSPAPAIESGKQNFALQIREAYSQ